MSKPDASNELLQTRSKITSWLHAESSQKVGLHAFSFLDHDRALTWLTSETAKESTHCPVCHRLHSESPIVLRQKCLNISGFGHGNPRPHIGHILQQFSRTVAKSTIWPSDRCRSSRSFRVAAKRRRSPRRTHWKSSLHAWEALVT